MPSASAPNASGLPLRLYNCDAPGSATAEQRAFREAARLEGVWLAQREMSGSDMALVG
jgi:hypothetical protein